MCFFREREKRLLFQSTEASVLRSSRICVLIRVCVCRRVYVSACVYTCPHTCICVRIPLIRVYVSSYVYASSMCPHTCICFRIRVYASAQTCMCPQTTAPRYKPAGSTRQRPHTSKKKKEYHYAYLCTCVHVSSYLDVCVLRLVCVLILLYQDIYACSKYEDKSHKTVF